MRFDHLRRVHLRLQRLRPRLQPHPQGHRTSRRTHLRTRAARSGHQQVIPRRQRPPYLFSLSPLHSKSGSAMVLKGLDALFGKHVRSAKGEERGKLGAADLHSCHPGHHRLPVGLPVRSPLIQDRSRRPADMRLPSPVRWHWSPGLRVKPPAGTFSCSLRPLQLPGSISAPSLGSLPLPSISEQAFLKTVGPASACHRSSLPLLPSHPPWLSQVILGAHHRDPG